MLYQKFNLRKEDYGDDFFTGRVGDAVLENVNPQFDLREYQKEAIGRFDFYVTDYSHRKTPTHLLYHMATGSGKTLVMAANMLQLYRAGYRNFVFFTRLGNIIEKTRENFLNPASGKYLFADEVRVAGKTVRVREVKNFDEAHPDDINIIFATTSLLHKRIHEPRENTMTLEDFRGRKVVLFADEAHNLNAETKSSMTKTEEEEQASWEHTVRSVFSSHPKNVLLEFTATIGWKGSERIKKKYQDKLIYEYPLAQFRIDGYSKEVQLLQSDFKEKFQRALAALVVSQYRRKVAEANKISLKPVVLFKSKKIADSEDFKELFHRRLAGLKAGDISALKRASFQGDTVLDDAFRYFANHNITMGELKKELQQEFAEEKCIAVNSKKESENAQLLVNSLEEPHNEIRAVFAVDKLNEGWDVLNLFDIVRLYETRDARSGKPGKTTVQEAQLIGRGARYFPFGAGKERYRRKFDDNADSEMRILEELHYHSLHNPKYIQEIKQALKESGIMPPGEHREISLRVKDSVKKSDFWKRGYLFLNQQKQFNRDQISSLAEVIGKSEFHYRIHGGGLEEERAFREDGTRRVRELMHRSLPVAELGASVIRAAMDRLEGFSFSELHEYFPRLASRREFVEHSDYLGALTVVLEGEQEELYRLSQREKLHIALQVLGEVRELMRKNSVENVGTTKFYPVPVKEKVTDKTVSVAVGDEQERGIGMGEPGTNYPLNIDEKDWYVFSENYGTGEEKSFVTFINDCVEELEKQYDEVMLLRNERMFRIFRFSDGAPMEPDFVLFLKKKSDREALTYQLFVEPKGGHLRKTDQWKEEFLAEIEDRHELDKAKLKTLFENTDFKLIGMPFYTEDQNADFMEKWEEVIQ